jgi:hypothetical protein
VGDAVRWLGSDEDVPEGSVGLVTVRHGDGDLEVDFGPRPTTGGNGRGGKGYKPRLFTFTESRLERAEVGGSGGAEGTSAKSSSETSSSGSGSSLSDPRLQAAYGGHTGGAVATARAMTTVPVGTKAAPVAGPDPEPRSVFAALFFGSWEE